MKHLAAGFLAVLLFPLFGFDFAADGQALCRIVYPDRPGKLEKMAAEDLRQFLSEMSGAKFAAVPESKAGRGPAIYVGRTRFAEAGGIRSEQLDKEEWLIRPSGGNLIVTGGFPAGSFYAAWRILNRLGCWSLSYDQTAVPKHRKLTLPLSTEDRGKPGIAGRMIYDNIPGRMKAFGAPKELLTDYALHRLRAGINGRHSPREFSYYSGDLFNFSHFPSSHTLCLYIDPDEYFKTHPEYFAMNAEGKRFRPKTKYSRGCICMTNPDVRKITVEKLRSMIRRDRANLPKENWPVCYDISILDVSPEMCLCPACRAVTEKHGKSGLLLSYVNYAAENIRKEYPEIMIRTLAYSAAADLPKGIRPEKNVFIQIADQFPKSDAFRPLNSDFNRASRDYLLGWNRITRNLGVWDYLNLGGVYFNPPRVETVADAIIGDVRFFRDHGFRLMFVEAGYDIISPQNFIELHYFLESALMMDPDRNAEELIDIFFSHYYGPCAPAIRRFFDQVRAGVRATPVRKTILTAANWPYFTPEFALNHYRAIKAASEKLPPDSKYRLRARKELIPLVWAVLVKRIAFEPHFKVNGLDMDALKTECETLVMENLIRNLRYTRLQQPKKDFQKKFARIRVSVPVPAKFRKLPPESIRVLGWPQAFAPKHLDAAIVADPESESGKALKSFRPDPAQHGWNGLFVYRPGNRFYATRFTMGNVGRPDPLRLRVKDFPADEKYRWYKMPGVIDLQERSCFWGHGWAVQFDTTPLYVLSDGVADNNCWECWFHAKFTGPAYVPGSKKENAIWVDYVVMTRPGLKIPEE